MRNNHSFGSLFRLLLLPGFALLFSGTIHAQVTTITGKVIDAETREPMPFVNVVIVGTWTGTLTDQNGNYALSFKTPGDSISAFQMGYHTVTRKFTRNIRQEIDFRLPARNLDLPEVVIQYKGNPAELILQKVLLNKARNTRQPYRVMKNESYTKIEIDAYNINEKLKARKAFGGFGMVWDYMDTSSLNGKICLPVFITETMSEVYFRRNPKTRKEIVAASSVSGYSNGSVAQYMSNFSPEINIYDNYIPLFEKSFISPVADFGINFYRYRLIDTVFIGGNYCFHITVQPRRLQELTFTGELWISDTSFAVKKVVLKMAEDANINFINEMAFEQEYAMTDTVCWMLVRDRFSVDLNLLVDVKNVLGFIGHKTRVFRNFRFDDPEDENVFGPTSAIVTLADATGKSRECWDTLRPEQLNKRERGIYFMVDSLRRTKIYQAWSKTVLTISTQYYPLGYFDIGVYSKLISFNDIEGLRFRIGARTSTKLSKTWQFKGYVAYGIHDHQFKYGADFIYLFNKNPRRDITAFYKYDVEQLGLSPTALLPDNFFASLFFKGPNDKLTMVRTYKLAYEHEWFNGLINTLSFSHRTIFPLGSTEFIIYPYGTANPESVHSITTSEIRLVTRLSFRERFVVGDFQRMKTNSVDPVINLSYCYGIPGFLKSDYEYHKVTLGISHWFNIASIGWSKYLIEAGKIWGTLPYPLLRIHEGNQTIFYNDYCANLMSYYEFVSDAYIWVSYTHHFDGLFFNKIPVIRNLKWREVIHLRGVYGGLSAQNQAYSEFPGYLRSFNGVPYLEAGAGIENIFKIFRVDCLWRLTHLHDPGVTNKSRFGLFFSIYLSL